MFFFKRNKSKDAEQESTEEKKPGAERAELPESTIELAAEEQVKESTGGFFAGWWGKSRQSAEPSVDSEERPAEEKAPVAEQAAAPTETVEPPTKDSAVPAYGAWRERAPEIEPSAADRASAEIEQPPAEVKPTAELTAPPVNMPQPGRRGEPPVSGEEAIIDIEEALTGIDEPSADIMEEPSAKTGKPSADIEETPALSEEISAIYGKSLAEIEELAAGSEQALAGKEAPSARVEPTEEPSAPFTPNREPSVRNKEPSAPGKEPSARNEEPSAFDKEPSARNEEPSAVDKEPSARNEEPSALDKEPSAPGKEPSARSSETSTQDEEPSATREGSTAWFKKFSAALKPSSAETAPPADVEDARRDIEEPVVDIEEPAAKKPSLFARMKQGLTRTSGQFAEGLGNLFLGRKEIDDELLEDIETQLLMADVGIDATTEIIDSLTAQVARKQLADSTALYTALQKHLLAMLQPVEKPLQVDAAHQPYVILVVGVNGVGKTTTIGKLAKQLQGRGHSVLLAAGDTFRAAAVEQLQVWGTRNKVPVVAQPTGSDSASVIFDAISSAKARGIDVVIADTAGRLHNKSHLMEELAKVKRVMGKLDVSAPHEVLLVLDAGTGQNAVSQADIFRESAGVTGLALTKLDGTAKGGVIFALTKKHQLPVRFIGVGEGIDDLQPFHAKPFVDALFRKTESP